MSAATSITSEGLVLPSEADMLFDAGQLQKGVDEQYRGQAREAGLTVCRDMDRVIDLGIEGFPDELQPYVAGSFMGSSSRVYRGALQQLRDAGDTVLFDSDGSLAPSGSDQKLTISALQEMFIPPMESEMEPPQARSLAANAAEALRMDITDLAAFRLVGTNAVMRSRLLQLSLIDPDTLNMQSKFEHPYKGGGALGRSHFLGIEHEAEPNATVVSLHGFKIKTNAEAPRAT